MQGFYSWRFVTLDGNVAESSSGLPVLPNGRLNDHPGGDYLCVVSSYDAKAHANLTSKRALRSATNRFNTVIGMDTGSWLMAHAGLLDGQQATIHLNELVAFSEAFDRVDAVAERYVIGGSRVTCGGAMTAFDLVLEMLRRTHGEALKLEVSSFFLQQMGQSHEQFPRHEPTQPALTDCIAAMKDRIEDPISISELAAAKNMSQRSLLRLFRSELGASPMQVYKRLRLGVARDYALRSNYPMLEIAIRCGYRDASAMTRAFVEQYGQTPSNVRRTGNGS